VRMALTGGTSLADGESAFSKVHAALRARGGGTISIYYHPNEWVHTQFWDAVNFSRGANPSREAWKVPGTRPAAETEQAFQDFEQYVRFMKALPGVRFVTATELMKIYDDKALTRSFRRDDILGLARSAQKEIGFQRFDGYALSAGDVFNLLTSAMASLGATNELPADLKITRLDGPARTYTSSVGGTPSSRYPREAFMRAVQDVASFSRTTSRIPDDVWIGSESLSPADYVATVGKALEEALTTGKLPAEIVRQAGQFTADRYVADDSPALWGWVIFPEGFHAPHLMELARLQAWTLKPAVLQR